jgi:hypothetical protein
VFGDMFDANLVLDQTIAGGSGADRDDCLLWQR